MAILLSNPVDGFEPRASETAAEYKKRRSLLMGRIHDTSDALASDEIVGGLIKISTWVGLGLGGTHCAFYVVACDLPFTIQFIPYSKDEWPNQEKVHDLTLEAARAQLMARRIFLRFAPPEALIYEKPQRKSKTGIEARLYEKLMSKSKSENGAPTHEKLPSTPGNTHLN